MATVSMLVYSASKQLYVLLWHFYDESRFQTPGSDAHWPVRLTENSFIWMFVLP